MKRYRRRPLKLYRRRHQKGNKDCTKNKNGKHYWLTPPELMKALKKEFNFTFDACPYPRPRGFDSLQKKNWGKVTYVNPPFQAPMKWVNKAIEEHKKGKTIVFIYPGFNWMCKFFSAGAQVRNLGGVKWVATEDGSVSPHSWNTLLWVLKGKRITKRGKRLKG